MKLMSEVMAHTITLHLLDAPGRVRRFMRKHADLADRLPKKELALLPQSFAGDTVAAQASRQDRFAVAAVTRRATAHSGTDIKIRDSIMEDKKRMAP